MTIQPTRRQFVQSSGALALGGALAPLASARPARRNPDETLRVGLVGCGGRGGGAAMNALMADPNTELVALGDL